VGYQESLIKVRSNEDFIPIVLYLQDTSETHDIFFSACTVVTAKEPLYDKENNKLFEENEKCICIQGERFASDKNFIFEDKPELADKVKVIPIENINDNTLNKMFKTHEAASEQPFTEYVTEYKNNLRISNVKNIYLSPQEYENIKKEYKEQYAEIFKKFKKGVSDSWTFIGRREAALQYLEDLLKLYEKYGDYIENLDLLCDAVAERLKKDYGLSNRDIQQAFVRHTQRSKDRDISIYHVSSNINKPNRNTFKSKAASQDQGKQLELGK
jgi:hypothetical protein